MWKSWEVTGLLFQVVNVYNLWHQLSHNCVYIVTQGKNQELFQSSEMKQVTLPSFYIVIRNLNLLHEGDIYLLICQYRKSIDQKTSTSYDVNYQLPCTGTCIQVRGVCLFWYLQNCWSLFKLSFHKEIVYTTHVNQIAMQVKPNFSNMVSIKS